MIEIALLLFLVIDPFGNLPIVLSIIGESSAKQFRQIIFRETLLGFLVLVLFALAGEDILGYLNIEAASLAVAGGVILFLISLKMIFRSSAEIFVGHYSNDPILVPIAIPSLAGPSAITTVMILRSQQQITLESVLVALVIVFVITCIIFLVGRHINKYLGPRGMQAMEKFMGLLLNLLAINMILRGIKEFLMA